MGQSLNTLNPKPLLPPRLADQSVQAGAAPLLYCGRLQHACRAVTAPAAKHCSQLPPCEVAACRLEPAEELAAALCVNGAGRCAAVLCLVRDTVTASHLPAAASGRLSSLFQAWVPDCHCGWPAFHLRFRVNWLI